MSSTFPPAPWMGGTSGHKVRTLLRGIIAILYQYVQVKNEMYSESFIDPDPRQPPADSHRDLAGDAGLIAR